MAPVLWHVTMSLDGFIAGPAGAMDWTSEWDDQFIETCDDWVIPYMGALISGRFFFNDTATTEIYTLSLHDALPISQPASTPHRTRRSRRSLRVPARGGGALCRLRASLLSPERQDRHLQSALQSRRGAAGAARLR